MAPFDLESMLGHVGTNLCYVGMGIAFGFILERAGFGNSRILAAQFYLKNMRVLKVMFTAIITAMLLIYWSNTLGLLALNAIWINPTYLWSGILGGLIFGVGFVIGGYCPGTALVSAATLKLDGLFFVLGLCVGIFIFGETVPGFQTFWDQAGAYGVLTLPSVFRLSTGVVVFLVVVMALIMFAGAEKIEAHFAADDDEGERL